MAFPERLLNPGEDVVVYARPHWKYLSPPFFLALAAVAGSIAALVAQVPRWSEVAVGAVLVLCLFWLAGRYLRWVTTAFVVTTGRLVLRRGVLRRSSREILIDRLTDITCSQSLVDRVLRCGDVLIESPGRDSPDVFRDLPHPMAVQNE
ncbi:MAG: PH domain-containing protein, partial [Acidimicrobiales bacterium]